MKTKKFFRLAISMILAFFLLVTISPPARAAGTFEVGDWSALLSRINAIVTGDTIKLTSSISIPGNNFGSEFKGKNVTFDLNGCTLNIGGISIDSGGAINIINTKTGADGTMIINSYLMASTGAVFGPVGSGVLLNVNGQVSSSGIGSSVTVNNISSNSYAVIAENGGQVTVNGHITVNTSYTGVYGASTDGSGSTITVNGNISVNGNNSYGVKIGGSSINANVTVNGGVTATGNYSSGVFVQGGSNQVNVFGGDVVGVNTGASINGGSGNKITVNGSVSASGANGTGTSIGFGSGHIIAVNGDVTANGTNATGALITSTDSSMITVGGNITSTGDGAYISGNGSVTVGNNITAGNYGANISGGGTVKVNGDIFSSTSGAIINGGGTVDVSGNITATAASDSTSTYGICINNYNMTAGSAKVTVGGNVSASTAFAKSAYGAYINNYNSTDSTTTVSVTGSVYAVSSGASAVGAQIYNYQSSTAGVTVGGNVEASGTDTNTGINAAGTEWSITAGGILAKNGTSNIGVAVSGSGTVMTDSISAVNYIKIYNSYPETSYSPGKGVLNGGTGYFEYVNGNTSIRVKGRTLTIAAETGGKAGIGGTDVTSGKYEAGTLVSLIALDSIGYDFDTWTATTDGSFSSANSSSTTFTMPVNNATVTAKFKTVPTYTITDSSAMSGGSITASISLAEAGDTVTLTVKPDSGKLFITNSLKYTYNSVDYPLAVTEGSSTFTATFTMPASDITVSAQFEDITVPVITTKTLPNGLVTASYSQSLVYESNAPVKWSVVSGTLPPGLNLSNSGVISGTPSAAASYTFTVQAENAAGTDTQELTINVAGEEPVIITVGLPAATEDSNYSAKLDATGISGIYWYISDGSLPDGLYIDNYNGTIYGTPSVEINTDTDYTFKITASNWISTGYVIDTQEFTLTVHPAPEFLLTLQTDGHGSITTGAVGNYEENSVISIGATPDSGYVFSGWTTSDGGSFADSLSTPTTYTMPGDAATVTANFVPGYNVNILPSDGGSITASTGFAASGVQITLTVAPDLGMQFAEDTLKYSYGGQDYPITVTENTAVFTMPESDVTLSAVFEKKPAIEVSKGADLFNTLGSLKNGDTIKLMASFEYSQPIQIDGITVILDTNGYTLTLSSSSSNSTALTVGNGGELVLTGSGALDIVAYNGVYVYNGGKATVTNVYSYLYAVYTDNGTVTVTGDVTAVGEWSYAVYAYEGSSVRVEGNVISEGNNSYAVYAYDGAVVTVNKAIISSGYITLLDSNYDEVFLELGDGVLNNTTDYFEYSTDSTNIRVKAWDLTVIADEYGSITTEVSGKYEAGAVIPISATASDGYSFGSWTCSNDGSFDDASIASTIFTMPAASVTVTAGFEKIPTFSHTVTVYANPTEGGSVSGGGTYEEGASVTVTALANVGYTFVNWTDDESLSVTDSVYSFNMGTADINLTANFQAIPIPVTTGTITGTVKDSGNNPISGATVSLTVGSNAYSDTTAADGSYSIADVPAGTGYTVEASILGYISGSAENVNVTANLPTSGVNITLTAHVKVWDLTVVAGEHGTITTEVSGKYEAGAVIPISATASDGYSFGGWTCSNDGSFDDASIASTTFTMPAASVTVTAWFEKIPTFSHTVTVYANPSAGGTVSGGGTYEEGASVTVTALANVGYTFVSWTDDESLSVTDSVYSFNMGTSDINLTANFQAIPVPVTTGTITGTVKDSGNSPISGATVRLTVGSNAYSATTAVDGSYSITDVPAGTGYTVVASISGYVSGSAVNVNVTANLSTSGVNIILNAIPESSSGGSAGTDTPPETFKITTSATGDTVTASTTAKTTVNSDGKTIAAVTQAQISEAINQAVAEAQRQGEGISARVEIKVDAPAENTTVETSIPKESVRLAVEDRILALTLTTPIVSITFDVNALSTISAEITGDVKITSSKLDVSTLSTEVQKIVGDRPIFDFSVTSGDRIISQFGGNISVSVPYTPKRGEDTNSIVIYYINAEGKPETVSNCTYNPTTGCVTFITNHFSHYVVGYNKVNFKDVARNAWYNKAVSFIAARGITKGTGNGNYSPGEKLTRGEFIVMIMRAYGIAPDTDPKDNFTDSGNTYYTGYLSAAKRLGISSGVGNNMFVPGKEITRQEMFSLLYNALKVIDQLPEGITVKPISEYSDLNQIAAWAKEAVTLFVKTGTISGSGDKLSPADTTTRAELAQVLYNLLSR